VNGRQVATSTAEIGEVYYRDTWYRLGMLKDVNEAISIDGIVDEARVSALARSSNWVWACWMNQTRQTGFPLYGPITEPFVDVDVDDIPDTWEVEHFGSITNVSRTSDHDGDGFLDWREERAGTSPTDASSLLRFVSAKAQRTSTNVVVRWSSESNRFYAINVSSSLSSPWTRLTNHLPATPPMNTYTVNQAGVPEQFFVIEVE
jgi:hypothetical protein